MTVLAALVATTATGAINPLGVVTQAATTTDTCGYDPTAAPNPNPPPTTVVFDENTVTRSIAFYGTGTAGHVGVFTNDESGLLIGAGGTPSSSAGSTVGTVDTPIANGSSVSSISVGGSGLSVAISSGDTIVLGTGGTTENFTANASAAAGAHSISVTTKNASHAFASGTNIADSSIVYGQAVPPTFGAGVDAESRPIAPSIYLTDITSNSSANGGDWEQGGIAANADTGTPFADALYGSWSPTVGTKPVNKNDWSLGPNADTPPAGTTSFDEGYGAEVVWNVQNLQTSTVDHTGLLPGHTYRVQSITHDTDQNHTSGGGDVGEVCTTFSVPKVSPSISTTLSKSSINVGDTIHDSSTLTGASADAGGTVKYRYYSTLSACNAGTYATPGGTSAGDKTVLNAGVPDSDDATFNTAGTYYWRAFYSGDGGNDPASSTCTDETLVVNPADVKILKKADASSVNAGDPIGFTITVWNAGAGDAYGVKLNDTLPTNAGLSWSIDTVTSPPGAGWNGTCVITTGVLHCGGANGVTVPHNLTQAASTFTVHIISGTTKDTAGPCPGSGLVDNTGNVTTTNDGNPSSEDTVCVNPADVKILKKADASSVNAGDPIGFTITVWNAGAGDAYGVKLNDTLPVNAGLSWSIDTVTSPPGAGWNGTCVITTGVLHCGGANGVTVPHNTTQAASTFTVHIISGTTKDTAGPCPGSGLVDNTGNVTTTNDGNPSSEDTVCVNPADIKILKKADASSVNAGDPIGFTITVWNAGAGDAYGVKLNDTLPTNAGLSWSIDTVTSPPGAGWNGTCVITTGVLHCGGANGVTVPHNTTQAASTFTVHIISGTTKDTAGPCPGSGLVDNTGNVTTTNDGNPSSEDTVCVNPADIKILKKADASSVNPGDPIGFTITVWNAGAGDAYGVKLNDTLPTNAGLSWSIDTVTSPPGAGWNGTCVITTGVLHCGGANGVTVPHNLTQAASTFTVHIISGTTKDTAGPCPGSGLVDNTGNVTTTNDGNPSSEDTVCVNPADIKILKKADASSVNAGDPIGFTITVWNAGAGDAAGVKLNDTLPTNAGLSWSIDTVTSPPGAGWNGTCVITTGVLHCGGANGVTVPHNTTQAASTFTVHIISPTTAATGGPCPGSGLVDNTGNVTTTNDGNPSSEDTVCVNPADVKILKKADASSVNAGDPIGFTITVWNAGAGDAAGVKLNDTLPTNAGLSWSIDTVTSPPGAGWNGTCVITTGVLHCGGANGVTVPHNTTQAASTFTVHIISGTTKDTAGPCPGSGLVDNTGNVTTTNDGNPSSEDTVCVNPADIKILKKADASSVNAGDPIGFTITVWNAGAGDAAGVKLNDTLPTNAGLSWSIDTVTSPPGAGWNGTCVITTGVLHCGGANGVTVPANTTQQASTFTVHIISPTTAATGGPCPGSGLVDNTGNVTTTNDGNPSSEDTVCVNPADIKILKKADASSVNAGDPIGFTITVWNAGAGDAAGVKLNDTLPTNAGLSWSIDTVTSPPGAGWNGTCVITTGVLHCGGANGVTVPHNTTQAASTFTVHIISPTTKDTAGPCPGSGLVDNTGNVTTTNDGNPSSEDTVCVNPASIKIVKTADKAQVNVGDPIGFTLTVYNAGAGDAHGVKLNDTLPTNPGLSWTIAAQGTGWGGSCAIAAGVLTCGGANGVTVPHNTTQQASTFTVHITSPTTGATGGDCPETGVVDNTGNVTTTNDGSDQSGDTVCVQAVVDLAITKSGSPATQILGTGNITWTMVVTNHGPSTDTNVKISDPMPAGNTYVSSTTTQGTCTGGAILNCDIGTMVAGAQVTITLVTTPSSSGTQTNTAVVSGDRPETTLANNTATATVQITEVITPPPCVAVSRITPGQLIVGRKTTLTVFLKQGGKAAAGFRVRIKGAGINVVTKRSNAKGVIKRVVKMKKKGVLVFTPLGGQNGSKSCGGKRIGVRGVFTPPVTG